MSFLRLSLLVVAGVAAGCGDGAPAAAPARSKPVPSKSVRPAEPAAEGGATRRAAAPAAVKPASSGSPEPVYRPDDDRPKHDDAELARAGIRRYESKRLVLYSDVPAEKVARLPALVDALYGEWVAYFGALPPARDGSEYQLTGYLIGDLDRFRAAGLVPEGVRFEHGRHLGRRFWMRDQEHDYYRSHLLLHEATHCYMTALSAGGPVWYLEGMAERFGTHRVRADGRVEFRIMPASPEETAGFGRITLLREEVAAGRFKTLDGVFAIPPAEYVKASSYAWWWAACCFLDSHPRYRERFRALGDPRIRGRVTEEFRTAFAGDADELTAEWALFAHTLRYGYDVERAAVVFGEGEAKPVGAETTATVAADRGWQSSGVRVEAGRRYEIAAAGRFTLADGEKPWTSDAGGISFDYFDGRPLGLLRAVVLGDAGGEGRDAARGLLSPVDFGTGATMTAPDDGVLYLRINDGWDRLGDNRGEVRVTVRAVE